MSPPRAGFAREHSRPLASAPGLLCPGSGPLLGNPGLGPDLQAKWGVGASRDGHTCLVLVGAAAFLSVRGMERLGKEKMHSGSGGGGTGRDGGLGQATGLEVCWGRVGRNRGEEQEEEEALSGVWASCPRCHRGPKEAKDRPPRGWFARCAHNAGK